MGNNKKPLKTFCLSDGKPTKDKSRTAINWEDEAGWVSFFRNFLNFDQAEGKDHKKTLEIQDNCAAEKVFVIVFECHLIAKKSSIR